MLRIKSQQYMQGFNQVNSQYTNYLNSRVSSPDVAAKKNEYMTQITNQLKDSASVDFSLPQNVDAAGKLFDPLLNDQAVMAQMSSLRNIDAQKAKMDTYKFSTDEKMRAMYHPLMEQHIADAEEDVFRAGMDVKKYQKLALPKFEPLEDPGEYLAKMAKDQGLEIKNTIDKGTVLVDVKNGKASVPNYQSWAESQIELNPNLKRYFSVLGNVEQHQRMRVARQDPRFAGMGDDILKQELAKDTVSNIGKSYEQDIERINTRRATIDAQRLAIGSEYDANATTGHALDIKNRVESLQQEFEQLGGRLSDVQERKAQYDAPGGKDRVLQQLMINPEGYYSYMGQRKTIEAFAAGRAVMTSVEEKKNDTFFAIQDSRRAERKLQIEEETFNLSKQGLWNPDSQTDGKSEDDEDGSGSGSGSSKSGSKLGSSQAITLGTTTKDVTQDKTPAVNFQNTVRQLAATRDENLYDPNSGMINILSQYGVAPADVVNISSALRKDVADMSYKFSKDEQTSADRAAAIILNETGIKVTGPRTMEQGLSALVSKQMENYGNGTVQRTADFERIFLAAQKVAAASTELQSLADQKDKLVRENIMSNPAKYKTILTGEGKNQRLIEASDIGDDLTPHLLYLDVKSNTYKRPTGAIKQQLGENYLSGRQAVSFEEKMEGTSSGAVSRSVDFSRPTVTVNGEKIALRYIGPGTAENMTIALRTKYGTPEQVKKLRDEAANAVVPNEQYFANRDGKLSPVISLPFDRSEKVKGERNVRVVQAAFIDNNTTERMLINEANNTRENLTPEQIVKLKNLAGSEKDLETYFNDPTYVPYSKDRGYLELSLRSSISKKEMDDLGLGDFQNKKIRLQISPAAQSGDLSSLYVKQNYSVNSKLLSGKVVTSPPIFKDAQNYFEIHPNTNDESATTATIYYYYQKWNPETQSYVSATHHSEPRPIRGEGAVNIDTLVDEANTGIMNNIRSFKQNTAAGPGAKMVPIQSLMK